MSPGRGGQGRFAPDLRRGLTADDPIRQSRIGLGGQRSAVNGDDRIQRMAASPTKTIEVDADLLERARRVADERGVAVPQLVQEALEHELSGAEAQPGSR